MKTYIASKINSSQILWKFVSFPLPSVDDFEELSLLILLKGSHFAWCANIHCLKFVKIKFLVFTKEALSVAVGRCNSPQCPQEVHVLTTAFMFPWSFVILAHCHSS